MHWCIQTFHLILLVPYVFHTASLVYNLGNGCEKVNSQGHRARKWWSLGQEPRFSKSKPHAHLPTDHHGLKINHDIGKTK